MGALARRIRDAHAGDPGPCQCLVCQNTDLRQGDLLSLAERMARPPQPEWRKRSLARDETGRVAA